MGTDDGLLKSSDRAKTWSLFRSEVPLNPDTPTTAVPTVETYAYPNPFSPTSDGIVRIRYELDANQSVTVRIFDFSSRLIRTLTDGSQSTGTREVSWDGSDDRGARVANGIYFYTVDADQSASGKILVVN